MIMSGLCSFQRKTSVGMLQIITLPEKQKYHITSCSSKLSRKQRFLAAFVILIEESFYLIVSKGK